MTEGLSLPARSLTVGAHDVLVELQLLFLLLLCARFFCRGGRAGGEPSQTPSHSLAWGTEVGKGMPRGSVALPPQNGGRLSVAAPWAPPFHAERPGPGLTRGGEEGATSLLGVAVHLAVALVSVFIRVVQLLQGQLTPAPQG